MQLCQRNAINELAEHYIELDNYKRRKSDKIVSTIRIERAIIKRMDVVKMPR